MALLFGMLLSKLSDTLVAPQMLTKSAFPIEGTAEANADAKTSPSSTQEAKVEAIEPLLVKANIEHGQDVAKKCLQCHTLDKGGPNKVGPNLWGVVGNKVAHMASYSYSSVFKSHGGTWSYEELNDFLYHPSKHMPGTKMSFGGLKKAQDRADVIAYLRTLSDAPIPLPK